ncbi:MAG TPA: hypothetical protein HA319_03645 [Nitrosopumilaceae archaeon]|nr:hypothetical protein [Nitrosopumilaceae archaeon]
MHTLLEKIGLHKFLLLSLFTTGIIMLVANFLTDDIRTLVTDLLYVPIPAAVLVLSIIITLRFKMSGKHGKAWIVFAIFAASWFVAEQIWLVYELILNIDPWPSIADFFYILGYPLLFGFSMLYLYPVRKAISKKLIISSSMASLSLLIATFILAYQPDSSENDFEVVLAASYPILDAIVFCPALIGVSLFFRGEVSFLWSLMCIAIILNVIGDAGFLLSSMNDSYYTGHPIDLLYVWAYILFAFGVYSHIRIFQSRIDEPYKNASELR